MDSQEWNAKYAERELVWSAEPNRFVAAELADLAPGRAIDLACGEGRNALWLAEKGWHVVAVDFSDVAIDKARQMGERLDVEVDWVVADVTDVPLDAKSFDLVLVSFLHLPARQMRAVFEKAATALAPNGVLFVIAHDSTNIEHGHGGPRDPAVLYGPEDVVAALEGLVVDRAERVRRPVETDDGQAEAIDVLVRAHRPAG